MYKFILAGILLILSTQSEARTELAFCNTCNTPEQYQMAAVIVSSQNVFENEIKIVNPVTGGIASFDAQYQGGGGGFPSEGPSTIVTEKATTSSDERSAQQLADANATIHQWWDYDGNRDVPGSVLGSALDALGSSSALNTIENFYENNQTLASGFASYVTANIALIGKIVNVNIVVELRFSDGSVMLAKITGIDQNGKLSFGIQKITDSEGNDIPTSKKEFEAKKDFVYSFKSYQAVNDYLEAAARYGIEIVNVSNVGGLTGSGSITDIVCDPEGKCKKA